MQRRSLRTSTLDPISLGLERDHEPEVIGGQHGLGLRSAPVLVHVGHDAAVLPRHRLRADHPNGLDGEIGEIVEHPVQPLLQPPAHHRVPTQVVRVPLAPVAVGEPRVFPPLGQRHVPVRGLVPVGVSHEYPVPGLNPRVLASPSLRHRVDDPQRVLHLPHAFVARCVLLADETLEVRGENRELLAVAAVHPAKTNRVSAHLRSHEIPSAHPGGVIRLVHRSLEQDEGVVLLLRGRAALVVLEPRLRVEQHEDVVGHLLEANHVRVLAHDDVRQPVHPIHQRHVLREPHVVGQQPDLREGRLDGLVARQ
mmetsp:Transcript_4362/g.19822  ORF Transcript_4362/g.19822 Transcript_4362/m.19822 type:complete len:309 (-) Transcript_4362:927-1853(-)